MEVTVSEIMLIVAGLMAFLIIHAYRKDKESKGYKATMVLGLLVGIALIACCAMWHKELATGDLVIISVAAFALIIRPFRDTDFAIIFALLAMAIIYVLLGDLTGSLSSISTGWPRIIVAFVLGAIVFMLLNFLQRITQLFGKFLNWWPILFILGLICLIEGILLLTGNDTIFNYLHK